MSSIIVLYLCISKEVIQALKNLKPCDKDGYEKMISFVRQKHQSKAYSHFDVALTHSSILLMFTLQSYAHSRFNLTLTHASILRSLTLQSYAHSHYNLTLTHVIIRLAQRTSEFFFSTRR